MRQGLPVLRRPRRGVPGRRARRRRSRRGDHGLCPLPTARAGPGRHAVELPPLAGHAFRGAGSDGRQRGPAQARLQRPPDGPLPPRVVRPGRVPRGGVPDPADRLGRRSRRSSATTGWWPSPSPGRARPARRWPRWPARSSRSRCWSWGAAIPFSCLPSADLDRAAEVATTARCLNNGQSCIAAKRFIVHDRGGRRVRAPLRRTDGVAGGGRPHGRRHRHRTTGHRAAARRHRRTGGRTPWARGPRS